MAAQTNDWESQVNEDVKPPIAGRPVTEREPTAPQVSGRKPPATVWGAADHQLGRE